MSVTDCICLNRSPEDYDGPMEDCPVHGVKARLAQAQAEVERLRAELARAEQATAEARREERTRIVAWLRGCARTVARGTEPDAAIAWLASTLESEPSDRCPLCGHGLDKHRRGGCGDTMSDGTWCQCIGASEALAADVPAASEAAP